MKIEIKHDGPHNWTETKIYIDEEEILSTMDSIVWSGSEAVIAITDMKRDSHV